MSAKCPIHAPRHDPACPTCARIRRDRELTPPTPPMKTEAKHTATPRVNAKTFHVNTACYCGSAVRADFARQLETELSEAKHRLLDMYGDDGTDFVMPEPGEFHKWLESDAALQWKGKHVVYETGKGVIASGDTTDEAWAVIKDRPDQENMVLCFVPDPDICELPFAARFNCGPVKEDEADLLGEALKALEDLVSSMDAIYEEYGLSMSAGERVESARAVLARGRGE